MTIGELVEAGVLEIRRGNEIGSQFYGTGDVPFVRTTDIVNWEIKMDPVKAVAEEVYEQYRQQQDVRENDILFVNDGYVPHWANRDGDATRYAHRHPKSLEKDSRPASRRD